MGKWLILLALSVEAYQLTIFVDARDLDYTSVATLWRSVHAQEDPSFGHAWIRLEGPDYVLEGGHTGEFGVVQPRYLEGVIAYHQAHDPNPIRYLWQTQEDGRFEEGSGGHTPTHQMTIELTEEGFEKIRTFIEEGHYPFSGYSLTRHQCTTFVVQVAALAGVILEHKITLPVESQLGRLRLWTDPAYSSLSFSSPDALVRGSALKRV